MIALLVSVLRIIFLRGSPERINYDRRLFIVVLLGAVAASAAAQTLYFGDHVAFTILRVFAEVTMFMVMMVLLTAKIPRFRLARMMLALVLISLLCDSLLILLSPITGLGLLESSQATYIAWLVALPAIYGAASVLAWRLRKVFAHGLGVFILYVAAVVGLDMAFRHLYQIMASG